LSEEELKEKFERREIEYDTSKLEIGIGDLAFYSMLSSSALIFSKNLIVMILTVIAIIIGTGITISGLKRNKILPGLPISIFLGIITMISSWYIISFFSK
jgi:presenilin-like A22 family membrane protease